MNQAPKIGRYLIAVTESNCGSIRENEPVIFLKHDPNDNMCLVYSLANPDTNSKTIWMPLSDLDLMPTGYKWAENPYRLLNQQVVLIKNEDDDSDYPPLGTEGKISYLDDGDGLYGFEYTDDEGHREDIYIRRTEFRLLNEPELEEWVDESESWGEGWD